MPQPGLSGTATSPAVGKAWSIPQSTRTVSPGGSFGHRPSTGAGVARLEQPSRLQNNSTFWKRTLGRGILVDTREASKKAARRDVTKAAPGVLFVGANGR